MLALFSDDEYDPFQDNDWMEQPPIWLVMPLVTKLPSAVQARILRVAAQVLERTNFFDASTELWSESEEEDDSDVEDDEDEEEEEDSDNEDEPLPLNRPRLAYKAFLSLILSCLKGQDDQKEGLLSSLHTQLVKFVKFSKEVRSLT